MRQKTLQRKQQVLPQGAADAEDAAAAGNEAAAASAAASPTEVPSSSIPEAARAAGRPLRACTPEAGERTPPGEGTRQGEAEKRGIRRVQGAATSPPSEVPPCPASEENNSQAGEARRRRLSHSDNWKTQWGQQKN